LLEAFNQELMRCFDSGELKEYGIPNIEQIAEKLGVSKRYLSDTLKKETGKTSSEHLQRYLIDESKNILLNPAKTVSDVAYELGFEYPPYFSRLFKKKEGISPSGYRELYRMN